MKNFKETATVKSKPCNVYLGKSIMKYFLEICKRKLTCQKI